MSIIQVREKYHYWYGEYIGRGTIYIGVDSEFIYKKANFKNIGSSNADI